jgi:hypothetical protein
MTTTTAPVVIGPAKPVAATPGAPGPAKTTAVAALAVGAVDKIADFKNAVAKQVSELPPMRAHMYGMVLPVALLILIVLLFVFINAKKDKNDSYMESLYSEQAKLSGINDYEEKYGYLLRDYYIKSAYNCCNAGDYASDFVSMQALKCVIRQGVRCLDFEIYSVDGVPVVASSGKPEFTMKETYNYLPFSDVVDMINTMAFTGGTENAPNPSDPLFLGLRIKSNNIMVYNAIADIINKKLATKLLDPRFGYAFHGDSIGKIKLPSFMNKVVIIIDETPSTDVTRSTREVYKKTRLYEFVNLAVTYPSSKVTFRDVKEPPNVEVFKESNKKEMKYVVPERANRSENLYPAADAFNSGCQIICMSFQSDDAPLTAYNQVFQQAGTAFKLKPPELRYVPIVLNDPIPADPTKTLTSTYTATTPVGTTYPM